MEAVSTLDRTIQILRGLPEQQLDMVYSYAQFVNWQRQAEHETFYQALKTEAEDPFYSEGNMKYLKRKMEDYKAGRLQFAEHELIEVDDV